MNTVNLRLGDNLATLTELKAAGAKFDLVELDGPYMAGLEDWDSLSEAEYIQHYSDRLALVRDVLQPWGVVFVFGYPEGCAEIKSWAHRSGTLYLRRWLTWYKQRTAHKGRKVENILLLQHTRLNGLEPEFKRFLKERRQAMGLKIVDACRLTGIHAELAHKVGGYLWFENEGAPLPTRDEYAKLVRLLDIPSRFDVLLQGGSFKGITELDYFDKTYPEDTTTLNDAGLRSKPVQLYLDLFRPTIPPTDMRRALVLYGGSGNAGIAAAALGYDVTICESDPDRVALIGDRWAGQVAKWTEKAQATQAALPLATATTAPLFGALTP